LTTFKVSFCRDKTRDESIKCSSYILDMTLPSTSIVDTLNEEGVLDDDPLIVDIDILNYYMREINYYLMPYALDIK
jgi:hypothetical protein